VKLVLLDVQKEPSGVDGEIIARVERRRQWMPEEKAALLAEVEASGGRVSVVARRHGISKSLLYNWRSAWRAAALVAQGSAPSPPTRVGFIQLGVVGDPSDGVRAMRRAAGPAWARDMGAALAGRAGVMEIDLPQGVRVRVDGSVDEPALRRVLSAVRGLR
jgi:transposase